MRIVDDEDQPVAPGEVGHLLTRGPYTIRGYWRAADHNQRAFTADGFYRTGDLVSMNADGYLTVEGRAKDQINRGGEKISAEEVENHLLAHPLVRDVAIVAMSDPIWANAPAPSSSRASSKRFACPKWPPSCASAVWPPTRFRTGWSWSTPCRKPASARSARKPCARCWNRNWPRSPPKGHKHEHSPHRPYAIPSQLPDNRVNWTVAPQRAALLIHDMQEYFLDFYDRDAEPVATALRNIAAIRARAS